MIKNIIILIVLFVSVTVYAQPGKVDVETVDGKKYYVHFIEQGQTLYGLHQMYEVPVGDIVRANNDLNSGLQIGQKVLIPIALNDTKHYGEHVAVKNETLYGISKKYKCSVSDLKGLNPELNDNSLSIGQVLKVPVNKVIRNINSIQKTNDNNTESVIVDPVRQNVGDTIKTIYTDSIITHKVLKHETLYSISKRYMVSVESIKKLNIIRKNKVKEGDLLKIKVKNVSYEIVENVIENENVLDVDTTLNLSQIIKKDKYRIALFLPLMLSKNNAYMNKPIRVGEIRELYPTTKVSSGFYHGFMLAADSLTKAGLNVEIFVYDTKKDTNVIAGQLKKKEFKTNSIDLIVGPFYRNTIKYMASYSKKENIPFVIPFKSDSKVLFLNPNIYKTTVSNVALMDGMIDFIVDKYSHYYITIIKPRSTADKALYEKARDRYNTKIASVESAYTPSIIELNLGNVNGRDINVRLRKDTTNVIVVPSTNLRFVSDVFRALNNVVNLNAYAKNMKIIVFGLEDWNKFKDIDLKQRMRVHQHYATYRFANFDDEHTKKMLLSYRYKYKTDPDKYGIQGFDVGYYFLSALHLYGENFEYYLENHSVDLIQNDFKFTNATSTNGHENSCVKIVEYSNYKLIEK